MYKLVCVGGKLRGEEFSLNNGENILGRDPSCDIHLDVQGVSKKHASLTVSIDGIFLEDLGSSNGTFVNKKIVKKITLKEADEIAVPGLILKVIELEEKKIITKKKVMKSDSKDDDDGNDFDSAIEPPSNVLGKLIHLYKYKFMPMFYNFNTEYEWASLIAVVLSVFVITTISLTISPILLDNRAILLRETALRGAHFADEIARMNAVALERKNLEQLDTKFLDNESGVVSYELFDTEGRIYRPLSKLNDYITDTFSIEAREWSQNVSENKKNVLTISLGDGEIGIAKVIKAYNVKLGMEEDVGIIALRFSPDSLLMEATNNSKAYLESLITSAMVAIIFFSIIYFLTTRNIEFLKFQIEQVFRGKEKEVNLKYKMKEFKSLVNIINTVLLKNRELQNEGGDGGEFDELEEDDKYIHVLKEFLVGAQGAVLILNSEKKIEYINAQAEDLTGIRESVGQGAEMMDVARDQGFAATLTDLCDQSASNDGLSNDGSYELSGQNFNIYVTALMGKDHFAKAFYVTFVKDE